MLRISASLLVIVALVLCLACKSDNVASGGSRLFLSADPQQIGFNGTSSLTVTGSDEDGAPLPDGTEVSFSVVQAGRVTPSTVKLQNGTGTSTYFATFVSGEITISAHSGSTEASTTVTVADDVLENVFVSANPASFPAGGGTSVISAVVTDGSGRPLQDVRVQFSTTSGTLQSNGDSIPTNSNGLATDTLNTSATAKITATTDDGFTGETEVLVGVGRIVCHLSVNTSTPTVGQTVSFFDTSDDPGDQIETYHWNFGDNSSADGQNVQHVYRSEGTFEVVHSVVDRQGNTTSCDTFPIVVSR